MIKENERNIERNAKINYKNWVLITIRKPQKSRKNGSKFQCYTKKMKSLKEWLKNIKEKLHKTENIKNYLCDKGRGNRRKRITATARKRHQIMIKNCRK